MVIASDWPSHLSYGLYFCTNDSSEMVLALQTWTDAVLASRLQISGHKSPESRGVCSSSRIPITYCLHLCLFILAAQLVMTVIYTGLMWKIHLRDLHIIDLLPGLNSQNKRALIVKNFSILLYTFLTDWNQFTAVFLLQQRSWPCTVSQINALCFYDYRFSV